MRILILLVLFKICPVLLYGQHIVTGFHGSSDYYSDVNPDEVVFAPMITFPSYNSDSLLVDLNNDNINDFNIIAVSDDGGQWYRYYSCRIIPLNNNQISISGIDTCYANIPSTLQVSWNPMAEIFASGDTIDENELWIDSTAYLAFYNFSANFPNNFGYTCADVVSPVAGYLGLKVITSIDTLYGWIKIQAIATTSVTIEEHACNIFSTGIEQPDNSLAASIFPNPFSEKAVLHLNRLIHDATLEIYNSKGQQVKKMINVSGNKVVLYRDNLSPGLYFMVLRLPDEIVFTCKLIMQ
jgi:Secretion system C-terminal sorting domain